MRETAVVALLLMSCGGPTSRDYRDDKLELLRAIAADAHTAQLVDPLFDRLAGRQDIAAVTGRLQGEVKDAGGRAVRRAREAKAKTPEGKEQRRRLIDAAEERLRVIDLLTTAARTGRPEDLLDAITAARELEESLADIEDKVEALGRD